MYYVVLVEEEQKVFFKKTQSPQPVPSFKKMFLCLSFFNLYM